jgi:hypothetical protein
MNRPGGNVTGVSFYSGGLVAKRLELLRELAGGDMGGGGGDRSEGGGVVPCSLAGVNPAHHQEIFGNPAVAALYDAKGAM